MSIKAGWIAEEGSISSKKDSIALPVLRVERLKDANIPIKNKVPARVHPISEKQLSSDAEAEAARINGNPQALRAFCQAEGEAVIHEGFVCELSRRDMNCLIGHQFPRQKKVNVQILWEDSLERFPVSLQGEVLSVRRVDSSGEDAQFLTSLNLASSGSGFRLLRRLLPA